MTGIINGYKAVVFDLDGTLLNTQEGIVNAVRAAVTELGYTMPSDEVLRGFIGPPMVSSMMKTFGLDRGEGERATNVFRRYYAENFLMQAQPYEGLYGLLELIKNAGAKIGVATFKRTDYGVAILRGFEIAGYCASICGDNMQSTKTKAEIIADCVAELGVEPERTLYIGDTRGDFMGAVNAGADFAAVTYGFGFAPGAPVEPYEGKNPVVVANTVQDVIQYLFKNEVSVKEPPAASTEVDMEGYIVAYDKNGAPLAERLMEHLRGKGVEVRDMGVTDDTYYPLVAEKACRALLQAGGSARCILVCGTGIGMCISANKIKGVYAAVCHDPYSAERAVLSNNANVFCFGAQVIGPEAAKKMVDIILPLTFKDGRSTPKLAEVYRIESNN